jgi:hypothetical protein
MDNVHVATWSKTTAKAGSSSLAQHIVNSSIIGSSILRVSSPSCFCFGISTEFSYRSSVTSSVSSDRPESTSLYLLLLHLHLHPLLHLHPQPAIQQNSNRTQPQSPQNQKSTPRNNSRLNSRLCSPLRRHFLPPDAKIRNSNSLTC